jgi:hypothetical protein
VARKPKAARKSATSGRKPGKTAAKKAASADSAVSHPTGAQSGAGLGYPVNLYSAPT